MGISNMTKKYRVVTIQEIGKCSRRSVSAEAWIPTHDCGDPECPMRGK